MIVNVAFALLMAAEPTCRVTLDSLDAKVRKNYAGFLLEVKGPRRTEYDAMLRRAGQRADTTALANCFAPLASYVAWYADPHLFVFQSQTTDTATAARRASSLRRVAVTEESVRAALTGAKRKLDPIEGIWFDGALRLAVVPDAAGRAGDFVAVVLASDSAAWPVGAVRAELRRDADGSYAVRLLTRGFAEMRITARIYKRTMLRLSPGIWGRAFPVAPADTGLVDPIDAHRPRVSVREKSVVVSLASHDPQYIRLLDSLMLANAAAIAARPLLIVDLRGNEGGASFMSRSVESYITSGTPRATPYDSGTAVMLSSPSQIAYARRFTGTDTSAFVRSLVARLEASPGALVPLEDPATSAAAGSTPKPGFSRQGDWQAIVLTDRGTVSASEVLVLAALRSTRATVVGEPTAGALDYQSTQIVGLGTGDRRWGLGYPTITAHSDLPRRGMRGKGIQPEVTLRWSDYADPIAEVERRFVRPPR